MNGRWDSKTHGAWAAISKAPYPRGDWAEVDGGRPSKLLFDFNPMMFENIAAPY